MDAIIKVCKKGEYPRKGVLSILLSRLKENFHANELPRRPALRDLRFAPTSGAKPADRYKGNAWDLLLAISFSSTDYVGHLFGLSSLETEDNILRLDRLLAELFQYVDKKIGLDKTLIVLSADHGAPESPEYMAEHGMETGRFPLDWFKKGSPLLDALKKRFGRDDLVAA